jgi:hypothetical protein
MAQYPAAGDLDQSHADAEVQEESSETAGFPEKEE